MLFSVPRAPFFGIAAGADEEDSAVGRLDGRRAGPGVRFCGESGGLCRGSVCCCWLVLLESFGGCGVGGSVGAVTIGRGSRLTASPIDDWRGLLPTAAFGVPTSWIGSGGGASGVEGRRVPRR